MSGSSWKNEYKDCVLNGKLDDAKKIILDNIGDNCLFKYYRGTKKQLDSVMNQKFWLSNAKKFNDPYDSLSLANVRTKSSYDRTKSEERELAYKECCQQIEENKVAYEIQSNAFVTCFSEVETTSLHMWSYYADEHKGFCVKYSVKKLIEAGIDIWPIIYVNADEWTIDRGFDGYNTLVSLRKEKSWEHEKEWRIVHIDPDCSKKGIEIDGILPEAIYVGCRDNLHIFDNYLLQEELTNFFEKEKVQQYVWENANRKISLNEIMQQCENFTEKKIPLYLMKEKEGKIELFSQKIQYLWRG